jgi:hypothetical protein
VVKISVHVFVNVLKYLNLSPFNKVFRQTAVVCNSP